MKIEAITFDVGGTLIETWPSVGEVYAAVAAEFGVTGIAPEVLNHNFIAAWRAKTGFDYSRTAWFELVRRTFAGRADALPAAFFSALYERFARPDAWRVFDDVMPALEGLRARGCRLGVISNWDERLRPLLERLGLARYFETILVSAETGWAKPAPEIFQRAAARLDLPPTALLHIGDSRREDVEGAGGAGWRALLLDRAANADHPDAVRRLDALVERFAGAGA